MCLIKISNEKEIHEKKSDIQTTNLKLHAVAYTVKGGLWVKTPSEIFLTKCFFCYVPFQDDFKSTDKHIIYARE